MHGLNTRVTFLLTNLPQLELPVDNTRRIILAPLDFVVRKDADDLVVPTPVPMEMHNPMDLGVDGEVLADEDTV